MQKKAKQGTSKEQNPGRFTLCRNQETGDWQRQMEQTQAQRECVHFTDIWGQYRGTVALVWKRWSSQQKVADRLESHMRKK